MIKTLRYLTRICFTAAALALLPALAHAQAVGQPPLSTLAASTEHTVQVVDFEWQDTERNREVPVRLYWPEGAADAKGKIPLVVFSHGLGGSRMGYSYLGRHWAAQGFASLHVQHVGSDRSVWGGSIFERYTKLRSATSDDSAFARAKDVSFAITALLNLPEYAQHIDNGAVAVAGHSYGANTALLLAGAKVQYQRKTVSLGDPRVKAAIILSAPPLHGQGDMNPILAGIAIPTMHLTGTEDTINVPGYNSGLEDRVEVFDAVGNKAKLLAVFTGGTHSVFTDWGGRAGAELTKNVKDAT
ncbi:MAG: alpha/beta hydrolase family protein, partial [Aeromonas sp.]